MIDSPIRLPMTGSMRSTLLTLLVTLGITRLSMPRHAHAETPAHSKTTKHAKQGAPVTIVVFGDKLVVKCADREVLDLIGDLIRSLMQAQATERDLEVFPLKYSDAAETADLIKNLFKATPTAKPQPAERMRTFVDPLTNTLIVQASPIDMMILRRLLSEGSDVEATEAAASVRTYMVGPLKQANAADVVAMPLRRSASSPSSARMRARMNARALSSVQ